MIRLIATLSNFYFSLSQFFHSFDETLMQMLGELNALVIVTAYRLLESYVQIVEIFRNASMFQTVLLATKSAKVL